MGAATVAVSRAGASSLAELAAMRVPAVLVPYPAATDNHQFHNARAFEATGAARLLEQQSATPETLVQLLLDVVEKPAVHEKMQDALAQWHAPHAAEQIAEAMLAPAGAGAGEGCRADSATRRHASLPDCGQREQTNVFWLDARQPLAEQRCRRLPRGAALGEGRMNRHNAILPESRAAERSWMTLAQRLSPATVIRRDEPLAKHTTLRVGGPADIYVEPASEEDLAAVLAYCHERSRPFFVLGRGSNLLVKDGGFRGVVICLAHAYFSRIEAAGERLRCGAGAKLKAVAVEARRNGLAGLEFLEGIPGSVGGALRMNAGAMGGAMFDVVESVRLMSFDGKVQEQPARELAAAYRSCPALKTHIALAAVLRGQPGSREAIEQRMNEYSRKRWTIAARRAERRVHVQEPVLDSRRQAD